MSTAPGDRSNPAGSIDVDQANGRYRRRFDLHGVIVERDQAPDRCTVYPRGADPIARTTTWISADLSAFESLSTRR